MKHSNLNNNNAVEINNLSFSYNEDKIFENLSLSIQKEDFVAIIGPNGAGKSTLIKLILNILNLKTGTIKIFNKEHTILENKNIIAYIPQILSFEKNFPATCRELFEIKGKINNQILEDLEITNLLDKQFITLSGGLKQRVLIAFALMSKPKLLILDEPTVGIDPKSQTNFYNLLKKLNEKEKITILFVTHDVGIIPSVAKKVLCINHNICCMGHAKDTTTLLKQVYEENFIVHHHHPNHNHDVDTKACCNHNHNH